MKTAAPPISFAGSHLNEARHVCAFFNSDDEEYRVLLPFIKDGFECGDKAVHVVNPGSTSGPSAAIGCSGDRPDGAPSKVGNSNFGPTPKRTFETAFSIKTGCWRPSSSWQAATPKLDFRSVASSATWTGRPKAIAHVKNLIEFESRVNDVWRRHDDAVICVYDLAKFGGDTVIDIMRTHPMIIIGGILLQNPFFVPPEQFLHELGERRPRRLHRPRRRGDMEVPPEHPAEEIKRLQRCINDLVSVLALPAIGVAATHPRLFAPCSTCC